MRHISHPQFAPSDIRSYMLALLGALGHLEKAKILHRDVKPGNFLYELKTGKGLLIDFGLAQTLQEAKEFPLIRGRKRRGPYGRPYDRDIKLAGYIGKDLGGLKPLPPQPHSGTHGYRAPEILCPVLSQECGIDTWSAGVVLMQMITGKTSLFRGQPTSDLYEITAIRSFIGTDRFIQGMSNLECDFSLTAGAPMPQEISLEEMCQTFNP
ncbi:hypothetical protein KIPB_012781, partial [Kipferlia bialata]|eukprot:g12781.t1